MAFATFCALQVIRIQITFERLEREFQRRHFNLPFVSQMATLRKWGDLR